MANFLGQLLVELGINTAAFKSGLDKATYQAKQFAKEASESLQSVGESLQGIASSFGELPMGLGKVLDEVGQGFTKLGAAAGPAGVAVGVAAAALTAVAGAAIGITVHAAESAEKIYMLSQATGVAMETLSGLSAVGRTFGIDLDSMAHGLERLDRTALQASTATVGTITPFDRLHISVRATNGQLKDTQTLFTEVANRFSQMQDGPEKTALAMQLFGRAGANLIPILNRSGDEIKSLIQDAKDFGAVLTGPQAEAGHKFEEDLIRLQLAGQGLENRLMIGLMPALNVLVNQISDAFKDNKSGLNDFMDGITAIAKYVIEFFELVIAVFHQLGIYFGDLAALVEDFWSTVFGVIGNIISNGKDLFVGFAEAAAGNFVGAAAHFSTFAKGVAPTLQEGFTKGKAIVKDFVDDSGKLWSDFATTTGKLFTAKIPTTTEKHDKNFHPDLSPTDSGQGAKMIEAAIEQLEAQADAEGLLSNAIKDTTGETIRAQAAAKAMAEIEKLEVEAKKSHTKVTEEQKERIEAATLRLTAYKAALDVNKQLEDSVQKTREQSAALRDQADAFAQGDKAVAQAQENAKLEPFIQHVNELSAAYDQMAKSGKFTKDQLVQFKTALDAATQKLKEEATALHEETLAKEQLNAAKFANQLDIENKELDQQIQATLNGAAALREFTKQKQLAAFIRENPFLSDAQVAQLKSQLRQIEEQENALAAAQAVHAQDHRKDIEDQIKELQKLREAAVAQGKDTLAYDAAIHQAELQKVKDLENELLATGKVGNGIKAFLIGFVQDATNLAQKVHDTFKQAFDGINQNLAELIVTGKANWNSFFTSLFEQIAQMAIEWVEAKTIMILFNKLFNDDSESQGEKQIASNSAQAFSAAGLAGANTLALASAVYLPPIPEGLSAAAYATGVGYASVASFDRGGLVSRDMTANVHKDEMVLPPDIAKHVLATAGNRQKAQAASQRPVNVHLHNTIQALDANGVSDVIDANMPTLVTKVVAEVRRHN